MRLLRLAGMVALVGLTACTSGMVLGGAASCSGSTLRLTQVTGQCERTIDKLQKAETQRIAVQTSDAAPFATVDFEVTVETGQVDVTFTDYKGDKHTTSATPDSPASGSVRVQLDPLSQIKFELAPVGEAPTGVKYQLSFVCDCMP